MKHTELIERLRAGSGGMKHWQELESEAADAIESLQAEVERVTESCNKAAKPSEPNYEMLRLLENANEDLIAIEKRQHSNPEILAADIRSKLNKAIDLCVIDIARAGFRWALTKQPTQPDRDELDALKAERDALKLDAERLTIQLRAAYGHVKGYYMNTCFECHQSMEFVGKRCHTCAACADKRIEAAAMKGAA